MSGCSNGQVNFFVLDTLESWNRSDLEATVAISDSGISLPVSTEYAIVQVVQASQFPTGLTVTSISAACCGILYLLDSSSHAVWTYDSTQSLFSRVPAISGLFTSPVNIAHQDGTLFVADTGSVRIFSLALLDGQIRWTAGADVASADGSVNVSDFTPVFLAAAPNGHLYALDNKNSTVLHFDEQGELLERVDVPPQGSPLTALARALDGSLYVLVGTQTILKRVSQGSFTEFLPQPPAAGGTAPALNAASMAVDSYGNIYLGQPTSGSTRTVIPILRFDQSGASLGSLPAYNGPADLLAIDCDDNLYAFQNAPRLSLLEIGSTYLIPPNTPPPSADYYTQPFDSGSTGTVWHRLVIDADLPADTQLLISFFASDNLSSFNKSNPAIWQGTLLNTNDALFMIQSQSAPPQNLVGRYLWLKFTLIGTETATPLVRSARIYFPRVSYLRYLPAIYSQDPTSRGFLERFLSIFESIFSGLETTTTNIVRYFDPNVVTGAFLQWLAGWLAIAVDETWTDDQLRALLLAAPDLFRERGTPSEIAKVISIYLGISPIIVEQFQLACAQDTEIQQVYAKLYGGNPYCFCVIVPPFQQLGAAIEGNTQPYPDADKTAVSSGTSVELVFGTHSYQIPLSGRNSLNGLRDAINDLAVGVVAQVRHNDMTPATYSLYIWAKRIGPGVLDLRTAAGDPTTSILTLTNPGSYTIVSPWSEENRDSLQRILDQEKPANTCGGIQVLQPRILLDMHSYLEVNSWLVKPTPMLDTGSSMPFDSVVDDPTWIGQAGVRSRLGLDTILG
jgi:phage tail-like protein